MSDRKFFIKRTELYRLVRDADFTTPTLQLMMKALKKLEDWFVFGTMLGVPVSQLKKIELSACREPERCKIIMLQFWLDNELDPTWNDVVIALEETDQLVLAAQIKETYLWSLTTANKKGDTTVIDPESSNQSSAAMLPSVSPDPPLSSSSDSTYSSSDDVSDQTSDEMKAEIRADVTVVSNLKKLEASFGSMLVKVKCHLSKCDLSDVLLFLDSVIGPDVFIGCDDFGKLIRQLQRDHHIGIFNIFNLKLLVDNFEKDGSGTLLDEYIKKKENFLKQTTVLEFQRAVVSRVKPLPTSGQASVTIRIPEKLASHSTLKDIEKLAMEGFEECNKRFVCLHAEPGSVIISWIFPKLLSGRLEQLARKNAAYFKDSRVMEVTVAGKLFLFTQQEWDISMPASQGADYVSEEEKGKPEQLFHQQLIDSAGDPDFSTHPATMLTKKRPSIEQLQQPIGRQECLTEHVKARATLQLMVNNETMTSDIDDLKIAIKANELQKTTPDMMAAVHEKDGNTSVGERISKRNPSLANLSKDGSSELEEIEESDGEKVELRQKRKTSRSLPAFNSLLSIRSSGYYSNYSTPASTPSPLVQHSQQFQDYETAPSRKVSANLNQSWPRPSSSTPTHIDAWSDRQRRSVTPSAPKGIIAEVRKRAEIIRQLKRKFEDLRLKIQNEETKHLLSDAEELTSKLINVTRFNEPPVKTKETTHRSKSRNRKSMLFLNFRKEDSTEETGSENEVELRRRRLRSFHESEVHRSSSRYSSGLYTPSSAAPTLSSSVQQFLYNETTAPNQKFSMNLQVPDVSVSTPTDALSDRQLDRSVRRGSLEPVLLRLSRMDFWHRAEQEFVLFTYKLLESPMKMNLAFENPQYEKSAAEALRGPALEFRRQLELLDRNRTLFCREVFKQKIGEQDFSKQIMTLIEKADKLQDDLIDEDESDEVDIVDDALSDMVQFTDTVALFISDVDIYRNTLKYLHQRYLLDHRYEQTQLRE